MIARELLVRLGFNIDTTKLDKFKQISDDVKTRMSSLKHGFEEALSPSIKARIQAITAYREELQGLSKEERSSVLELNKVEKQAIKETTLVEKAELKERQRFTREQFKEKQTLQRSQQRDFKTSMASMSAVAQKFAIVGASITAGFGLSLRSTLKDAANFKEGKSSSVFDKSQIMAVDAFNKTLNTTRSTVASLRNSFVIDMLPAIKETLEVFNAWVQKNKVLIQEKLKDIVVGLAGAFKILSSVIGQVVSILDFIISKTIGWRAIITAVISLGVAAWFISLARSVTVAAVAFRALTVAMLTNPVVLFVAGVASVIAILVMLAEEIYYTIQGADTLTNRFFESDAWKFYKMGIDAIVDSLKDMWQWLVKVKDGIFNFPSHVTTEIKGMLDIGKNKFNEMFNNDKGKLGQGNVKHFALPKYEPAEVSRVLNSNITNNARSANITQKNSFNMNITVPTGTTQGQSKEILTLVRAEIEKNRAYETEKTLAAIGSY
jgi:hypothetical protein